MYYYLKLNNAGEIISVESKSIPISPRRRLIETTRQKFNAFITQLPPASPAAPSMEERLSSLEDRLSTLEKQYK